MSRWPDWTEAEDRRLADLIKSGRHTYGEVADLMGRARSGVTQRGQRLGLKNPAYLKRITKTKHLRGPVMKYYQTHTRGEAAEHFDLSLSEVNSILSVCYLDKKYDRLRKDTRRHDAWSVDEKVFLIRHAGIQPRKWIAKRLKRGGVHAIKEELNRLGTGSKFLHGMPRKYLAEILGPDECPPGIKTKAGPTGGSRGDFRFIVVPWVKCEELVRDHPRAFSPEIKSAVRAMAKFQRWIFQTKHDPSIIRKLRASAQER